MKSLSRLLALEDHVRIVDVGANGIEGDPPYHKLVESGLARLTGFEPQAETVVAVSADCTHLPWALGDGSDIEFRRCLHSGFSGSLEPARETIAVFSQYAPNATVLERATLPTRRLDDVAEIEFIDYLKIDIQGGELAVFANGRTKLERTLFVHTEVSFVPLYEDQPTLGDVDNELRQQGFLPHCFGGVKKAIIPPLLLNNDCWTTLNQLLDGDLVYVRDFRKAAALSERQLRVMALIAHACYGSFDLAYYLLRELARRAQVGSDASDTYLSLVNSILNSGKRATP
ncbi:MAG: FkbM family methyltransferase [Alphaproteobacteria bacterium]|nr:FkbM family methyltransferase [Alphaproteobacteria bacterium]